MGLAAFHLSRTAPHMIISGMQVFSIRLIVARSLSAVGLCLQGTELMPMLTLTP